MRDTTTEVAAAACRCTAAAKRERLRRRGPPRWLVRAVAWLLDTGVVRRVLLARQGAATLTPSRLARGLSRATKSRAARRLTRLPCFSATDYVRRHEDLTNAAMAPAFHALFIGPFEERTLFRTEVLARCLARPVPPPAAPAAPARLAALRLLVSSLGNAFMQEIAADLAASLRGTGVAVTLADESTPPDNSALTLVVGPHEFFRLGRGVAWLRDDIISSMVMLNTEQPQTKWFAFALPFLLAGRAVVDLCPQTTHLFAQAGVAALHVTPSPHIGATQLRETDRAQPLFRVLPAAAKAPADPATPLAARAIDIAWFGAESPHREAWLARHAACLADYECVVHYRREARGPIGAGTADGALTRLAQHVCGHARITLNLHRDAFGLLEWHRVVRLGMAAGSVVVSEPCLPHPRLTPGVHYLEENTRHIPNLLDWLLRSADGRHHGATIQRNAAALLATELTPADTAARLNAFLASLP